MSDRDGGFGELHEEITAFGKMIVQMAAEGYMRPECAERILIMIVDTMFHSLEELGKTVHMRSDLRTRH